MSKKMPKISNPDTSFSSSYNQSYRGGHMKDTLNMKLLEIDNQTVAHKANFNS